MQAELQLRTEAEAKQQELKSKLTRLAQQEQTRESEIVRIQGILKEKSSFAQTVQRDLTTLHQQVAEMHRALTTKSGRLKGAYLTSQLSSTLAPHKFM